LTKKTNRGKGERDIALRSWRNKKGKLRRLMEEVESVRKILMKSKGK